MFVAITWHSHQVGRDGKLTTLVTPTKIITSWLTNSSHKLDHDTFPLSGMQFFLWEKFKLHNFMVHTILQSPVKLRSPTQTILWPHYYIQYYELMIMFLITNIMNSFHLRFDPTTSLWSYPLSNGEEKTPGYNLNNNIIIKYIALNLMEHGMDS